MTVSAAGMTGTAPPYDVPNGAAAVITISPAEGWHVLSVADSVAGAMAPASYTIPAMTQDRSVAVVFAKKWHLTVEQPAGGYIEALPGPEEDGAYWDGAPVTLSALPEAGFYLESWTGAASGDAGVVTVTMTDNKTVSAVFAPIMYQLTVSATTDDKSIVTPTAAGGTVAVYVNGATTPLSAADSYTLVWGTRVRMVAAPLVDAASGVYFRFNGWGDGWMSAERTFTVTADTVLEALFVRQYQLTVATVGPCTATLEKDGYQSDVAVQEITVPANGAATAMVDLGASVILRSETARGWQFDGWTVSGAPGVDTNASISLEGVASNLTVTATASNPMSYAEEVSGDGYIACMSEDGCTGTTFTLQAVPNFGSRFSYWKVTTTTNGISSSEFYPTPSIEVTPAANMTVKAVFLQHNVQHDFQALLDALSATEAAGIFRLDANYTYNGHSMPDIVPLLILENILKTKTHPLYATVSKAYWDNVAVWYDRLVAVQAANPNFIWPSGAIIHTSAAYSTISDALDAAVLARQGLAASLATNDPTTAVDELGLTGDADGDGFMNIEEWLYFDWRFPHQLEDVQSLDPANWFTDALQQIKLIGLHQEPGSAAFVPSFTNYAGFTVPPTVSVAIEIEGDGTTVPASGGNSGGAYRLSKYRLTDWWIRNADTEALEGRTDGCVGCAGEQIKVNAVQTGEDVFTNFYTHDGTTALAPTTNPASSSAGLCYATPMSVDLASVSVPAFTVTAKFSNGIMNAFARYLYAQGVIDSMDDVYACTYDRGKVERNGDITNFTGNGLADVAEFAMLDRLLADDSLDFSGYGGATHECVYNAYQANHAAAMAQLGAAAQNYKWLVDVVAGYMTLGDDGYDPMIRDAVTKITGVILPEGGDYDKSQYRYLGVKKDADNDGVANKNEWPYTGAGASIEPDPMNLANVTAFAGITGDPGAKGRVLNRAATDRLPNGPALTALPECWNDSLNMDENLITLFMDSDKSISESMPFTAKVKLDPDEEGFALPITTSDSNYAAANNQCLMTGIHLRPGRIIELTVTEQTDKVFEKWEIPGTLVNGSNETTVQFTVSKPGLQYITASARKQGRIFIECKYNGDTLYGGISARGVGPYANNVYLLDSSSRRDPFDYSLYVEKIFSGPRGATLEITHQNVLSPPLVMGFNVGGAHCVGESIKVMFGRDDTDVWPIVGFCQNSPAPTTVHFFKQPYLCPGIYNKTYQGDQYFSGIIPLCSSLTIIKPYTIQGPSWYYNGLSDYAAGFGAIPETGYYISGYTLPSANYQTPTGYPPNPTATGDQESFPWIPEAEMSDGDTISAIVKPSYTLDVEVVVEGSLGDDGSKANGGATDDPKAAGGYIQPFPAEKYFEGSPHPTTIVQLTAVSRDGYYFKGLRENLWVEKGKLSKHPGNLVGFKAYEESKPGGHPDACHYDTQPSG